MGLSKTIWTNPTEYLKTQQPENPVLFFAPSAAQAAARRFIDGFPGLVTYAVKSNPGEAMVENLAAAGIRGYDCASPFEIDLIRRLAPDAAIHYNPRITKAIGAKRAARCARFLRDNLSGLAANISLGFMLGLTPVIAAFFGLGLDVRHVTLSSGQMAAAASALGPEVIHMSAFWWSIGTLPFIGALNVLVSFYLAFRLALRAQNVTGVERSRLYVALRHRLFHSPLSFFAPSRKNV